MLIMACKVMPRPKPKAAGLGIIRTYFHAERPSAEFSIGAHIVKLYSQ